MYLGQSSWLLIGSLCLGQLGEVFADANFALCLLFLRRVSESFGAHCDCDSVNSGNWQHVVSDKAASTSIFDIEKTWKLTFSTMSRMSRR